MTVTSSITREMAAALLSYDKETGVFTWLSRPETTQYDKTWNIKNAGSAAGSLNKAGYVMITLKPYRIYAHRLAFVFVTGCLPDYRVDHINGNRADNRWENLRGASDLENSQNRNAVCGLSAQLGVYWHKQHQKWGASINHLGRQIFLGTYATETEASIAYRAARRVRNHLHRVAVP